MASRGSPGVLESTTTTSSISLTAKLPHDVVIHTPSKKRKTLHESRAPGDVTTSSITIRAHEASSFSDESYILNPIAVLPRSRLPLSWLDTTSNLLSPIQPGSLFVADIPALEDDLRERAEPTVLAARLMGEGGLYVIEKVKRGIYALCKLGRWVEEGDVFVAVKGWSAAAPPQLMGKQKGVHDLSTGGDWWCAAQVEEPAVDEAMLPAKRVKFDVSIVFESNGAIDGGDVEMQDASFVDPTESRSQSLAPPRLLPMERSSSFDPHMSAVLPDSQERGVGDIGGEKTDALQSSQELLDGLREQYLQALYISKTSVAYFAKGPLARCRAAFQSSELESSKKPTDLIEFYREAILNAKKMDLKYRETLPSTIRDIVISVSDDESTVHTKKRKSKKKKLGKNGLYPEEGGFVRKWWKDRSLGEHGTLVNTSQEAEAKKHVADLRLRETQLQILLILETMALELAVAEEAKKAPTNEEEKGSDDTSKNLKAKKSQDLNVMLELHLDRLCIWHAVSFEDTVVADSVKAYDGNHLSGKKVESDAVRDFCTEVIIPFYASRLPDKCKLITRKFGVSSAISPATKQSHARKPVPRGEPGAAAKRQPPQKPRRSLQRVLTDEQSASQGRHPSLSRSNTAPSQAEGRRDSMEPLLPSLSSSVRGGIQKAKRVENREVDLNAVARQHETKLKKVQLLVDQKKELDAAIHALRKPNRELVARDIADDADKRTSSGRKAMNPVRNPFGQGVQVMATPKGSRKRDVAGLPPLSRSHGMVRESAKQRGVGASSPFGSDAQVIPGSAVRASSGSKRQSRILSSGTGDTNNHNHNQGLIQETPSRQRPPKMVGLPAPSTSVFDDTDPGGSSGFSGNLFRVPSRPAPPRTNEDTGMGMMAPSTPVASRSVETSANSRPVAQIKSSSAMVMETPPKKGPTSMPILQNHTTHNSGSIPTSISSHVAVAAEAPQGSPAAVFATPVKKSAARLAVPKTSSAIPVTPEKSIYETLGWDDDDELGM